MSADRETRRKLEEVQQRLAEVCPEVELEESPGFSAEMNQLREKLDLSQGRGERTEERLNEVRRELEAAEQKVKELELAAQAKQSNAPPDSAALIGSAVALVGIALAIIFFQVVTPPPRDALALIGLGSSLGLGALLRARITRPKPDRLR